MAFNLVDFYHNESTLVGVDSAEGGLRRGRGASCATWVPAFEKGELPLPDVQAVPLKRGLEFYRLVDSGQVRGKVALTP